MPPRRAHTKSRNGCLQCRQRRVKCGEDGLPCGNCVRRELSCAYPPQRNFDRSPQPKSVGFTHSTSPDTSDQQTPGLMGNLDLAESLGPPSSGLARLQELQLMHHYTTVTCASMAHGDEDIDIWRVAVPNEAAQHEFLMDGLLALSALHTAHLRPSESSIYTAAAIHYQSLSLLRYHTGLTNITDSNCRAIFACSMIVTIFTLAVATETPDRVAASPQKTLVTMFELLRGNVLVIQTSYSLLNVSAFSPIFTIFSRQRDTPPAKDVSEAMGLLHHRISETAASPEPGRRRQIYLSAVDLLEQEFGKVARARSLGSVVGWPVVIDHVMINLLTQEDPMAQLIFAHYGVLLLHVHDVWWGRDFGRRLIQQMCDCLHSIGREWVRWTAWAREKVRRLDRSTADI